MRSYIFKQLLFYIVLFITTSNAVAQLGIGLVGGLNHSSVAIENQAENTTLIPRNGIIIGASSNYILSEHIYLSGQLRYIETGQDVEWRQFIFDYSEAKINYLQLPIHFNYTFIFQNVKPKFFCGAYIGYLLKSTGRVKINNEIVDESEIDGLNKIDFGIDVGAGLDIHMLDDYDLFINACYSHGLIDANSNEGSAQNRGYQITLGIMYYLGSAI